MAILIKNIINDTDKKSYFRIITDLSYLFAKYRILKDLKSYRTCLMYKKDAGNINDYVPYRQLMKIINNYFKRNEKDPILSNKIRFSEYLRDNNLPTAKFLGTIQKGVFYDRENNSIPLTDNLLFLAAFSRIIDSHPSLFVKQIDSYGGNGIFKINNTNIQDVSQKINLNNDYIIEETLTQDKELSKINPSCINTLRVMTYRDGNNVSIPSTFLRMGIGNVYVDNASAGGIFINYDLNQNKLDKTAYSLFEYGGKSYNRHPDTNFIFEDKNLIYPEKVKDVITKAALLFDRPVVGWDIAYTPTGPVIIEGNENPHIMMIQITCKGILSNDLYKSMFKNL